MRRISTILAALAVLALVGAMHQPAAPARAAAPAKGARTTWPDTPAGAIGKQWVEAFGAGDSAMRAFYGRALGKAALAERSVAQRLERYRELREQYGTLKLFAVVKSTPAELTASLMDAEAKRHEFVFKVEPAAPHRLVSVAINQRRHGLHGFHH
jgi:hypothetical protein